MMALIEQLQTILIAPFLDFPFLKRALVASIMIAISSGVVGVFLLLNRMSLAGDALSHGVLPGIAVGFLFFGFNLVAMSIGGMIAGLLVALLASFVANRTNLKEDASFAGFYLLSLAIGVIMITKIGSQADLMHILFGSVLAVDQSALVFIWWMASGTLLMLSLIYRPLLLYIIDPLSLELSGRRGIFYYALFLFLTVLNLVASFQVLGTLMAVGLMMIPAISARLWSNRMETIFLLTLLFGVVSAYVGLLLSFHYDIASGPMIILVLGGFYLLSLSIGREGGIFKGVQRGHKEA